MSAFGINLPTVRVLSALLLIGMVANPNLLSFVVFCFTQTHSSLASVTVIILFWLGVTQLVRMIVSLVLPS